MELGYELNGQEVMSPLAPSIVYAADPLFLASQEELRALLFNTARSTVPTRAPSPSIPENHRSRHSRETSPKHSSGFMRLIVTSPRRLQYLQNYIQEIAPWLDMFDMTRTFQKSIVEKAKTSEALLCAILALSARQLERKQHMKESFESLELYQQSIRLMAAMLPSRNIELVAIAVILCCLEMMSASARDWRRHLEGCATLFEAFEVHGFSGGMSQAVFWCYARMDLCGALISDTLESTLLPLEKWIPSGVNGSQEVRAVFRRAKSADMWANYAVYLCAEACKLLSDRTRYVELGIRQGCDATEFSTRWSRIWDDLQSWLQERPLELQAIETIAAKPFPHILYIHFAAISANQIFHTSCILLLNNRPSQLRLGDSSLTNALWHAKRVCGISQTNTHHGCAKSSHKE